MAKKPRTPERAAAVLDRAAKMRAFKPGLMDRRIGDQQIRTPGHDKRIPVSTQHLGASDVKRIGTMDVPLSKIVSEQPSVSLKAVKAKLTAPPTATAKGNLPQLIALGDGRFAVADGNHRITAARALRSGSVRADVAGLNAPAPAPRASAGGAALGALGAAGAAVATATAGVAAYQGAKAQGDSTTLAVAKGLGAAGTTAALPAAFGGAISMAARGMGLPGKVALQVAGKAALPLAAAGMAGYYGYRAAQAGKSTGEIVGQAAWGAVNAVLPIDMVRGFYNSPSNGTRASGSDPSAAMAALSPSQAKAFARADASRAPTAAPQAQPEPDGEKRRGFANPSTQYAAQEGRGVQNFSQWAQPGRK